MTDSTFARRKRISFVIANATALLTLAAICIRLVRHWHITPERLHFGVVFLMANFVLLWLSLVRDKDVRLSWGNLRSLLFAVLVLLAAEVTISALSD
jgi:hypothetical protein